jgi:sugar lactone lactonase YvrE
LKKGLFLVFLSLKCRKKILLTFITGKVKMNIVKSAFAAASIALITACGGGSSPLPAIGTNAVVTTLAGTVLQEGSTDATGAAARFNSPYGVAVDANGNVYLADSVSHTIRKTTSAGVVTTLAGSAGQSGSTDGTGISARFKRPNSVAVDSSRNLYVTDGLNNTIRKITSAGVVTTVAGTAGTFGVRDGLGEMARFDGPGGIAVDSSGNLYVSDTYGARIRKITPAGAVTTLAGSRFGSVDGTGASAEFNHPTGVAIDSNGNLYVADRENHTIRKITSAGVVTTLAGTAGQSGSTDATGAAARFNKPTGVAVDASGNVYVADRENHTIRKITSAGVVTTLAGTAGQSGSTDATGTAARFRQPHSVYVDPNGNIYVADLGNRTIRKITMTP